MRLLGSALLFALVAFGADNSLGTWILDVSKSSTTPIPKNPAKAQTNVREAIGGSVKVTITEELADGKTNRSSAVYKYDGQPAEIVGFPTYDRVAAKQIDANHFVNERWKEGGQFRVKSEITISDDGRTMTITTTGTNATGEPLKVLQVYHKQEHQP